MSFVQSDVQWLQLKAVPRHQWASGATTKLLALRLHLLPPLHVHHDPCPPQHVHWFRNSHISGGRHQGLQRVQTGQESGLRLRNCVRWLYISYSDVHTYALPFNLICGEILKENKPVVVHTIARKRMLVFSLGRSLKPTLICNLCFVSLEKLSVLCLDDKAPVSLCAKVQMAGEAAGGD